MRAHAYVSPVLEGRRVWFDGTVSVLWALSYSSIPDIAHVPTSRDYSKSC